MNLLVNIMLTMNGTPTRMTGYYHENVAVLIHSIKPKI